MKILGLDIGIGSCGWALVDLKAGKITDGGVRCFPQSVVKNDSLRKIWGDQKRMRRTFRRRRKRLRELVKLFVGLGVVKSIKDFQDTRIKDIKTSPWDLRVKALTEKLSGFEWAQVLYHLARHRGFKSNRKDESEAEDKKSEEGKIKEVIDRKKKDFEAGDYQTIGEYVVKKHPEQKRNKERDYEHTLLREWLKEEAEILFAKQRALGNPLTEDRLKEDYLKLAFEQHPMQSFEELVGECNFIEGERRASRSTWAFEYSRFLQKLNNIGEPASGGTPRRQMLFKDTLPADVLSSERKESIKELFYTHSTLNWGHIKKKLDLDEKQIGNFLRRDKKGKSSTFTQQPLTQALIELFKEHGGLDYRHFSVEKKNQIDDILQICSYHHDLEAMRKDVKDKIPQVDEDLVALLCDEKTFGYLHKLNNDRGQTCLTFLREIIPHLEEGLGYDKACEAVGYDHYQARKVDLEMDVNNATVRRGVNQTAKVVKAVLKKHGKIDRIHIEVAREIKHSFKEKKSIEKGIKDNTAQREEAVKEAKKLGLGDISGKGEDMLRMRLWKEQNHFCAYSEKCIEPKQVLSKETEIDHIIPRSRSYDDSQSNKVLCFTSENQRKGNQTPKEYLSAEQFERLKISCWSGNLQNLKRHKKKLLLIEDFDAYAPRYINRNLNDTHYISRFLTKYLSHHPFIGGQVGGDNDDSDEDKKQKRKVFVRNGALTAMLRWQWKLDDLKYLTDENGKYVKDKEGKRKERVDDRNHFVDAVVVALTKESVLQSVSREAGKHGEEILKKWRFSEPMGFEGLREKVEAVREGLFISRMVQRKMTGEAHEQTIRKKATKVYQYLTPKELKDIFRDEEKTKRVWVGLYENKCISHVSDERAKVVVDSFDKKAFGDYLKDIEMDISKGELKALKATMDGKKPKDIFKQRISLASYKYKKDKDGTDILDKLYNPNGRSNHIYRLLQERINAFAGKSEKEKEKMFSQPLTYTEKGKTRKLRKVTIDSGKQTGIRVRGGLANRGSMVRSDIFSYEKNGKKRFAIVPVYVCDLKEKEPPKKYIQDKNEEDRPEIDENFTFVTSLYPDDLVEIKMKGKEKVLYHYVNAHRKTGRIQFYKNEKKAQDKEEEKRTQESIGTKCESICRLDMDELGNIYPVKEEKRLWPGGRFT